MVQTGDILTAANVGDSLAVLDTGCSVLDLSETHRLQRNKAEAARLRAAGLLVAQTGLDGVVSGSTAAR